MVVVAKGYRVVPQRLACGAQGFRHVHLKEHSGSFKAKVSKKRGGDKEVIFAKGTTLFIGNIDDQGEHTGYTSESPPPVILRNIEWTSTSTTDSTQTTPSTTGVA